MKVLVNALSARKGGIVTYTQNLLDGLKRRGIDVTIVAPNEMSREDDPSVDRMNITSFSPFRRFLWEQTVWRGYVKRNAPDILFSSANFGLLNSPVKQVLLLREGGLFDPFYLANMTAPQGLENAVSRYFRRKLMLMSASAADYVITPTTAMRDMVANWRPGIMAKCGVNPYGTINDSFKPGPQERAWRADGVLRLLYVSVYYPHKVPRLLCQAVDKLNEMGIKAHATITISFEEFQEMKGSDLDYFVVKEALDRGIVTLGHHDYKNLPTLYREHDVFVFPSVSETFGHPMVEAMSTGIPVIVSETPVNREICGDAALYFTPFSYSELVERILELDSDQKRVADLSSLGRQRATSQFDWDGHVDRLLGSFEKVIQGTI
jgi:glycosyltransferase involved in cell wall biosynthesis